MRGVQDDVLPLGRLLQLHGGAGAQGRQRGGAEGLQEDLLPAPLPGAVRHLRTRPARAQVPVHARRTAHDAAQAADQSGQLPPPVEASEAPVEPH